MQQQRSSKLERLVEWHVDQGTDGIVPMGTTGESATIAVDEHLEVISKTVAVVNGRIPVVAGTGANATAEAIHLTRQAEEAGADACLSVITNVVVLLDSSVILLTLNIDA